MVRSASKLRSFKINNSGKLVNAYGVEYEIDDEDRSGRGSNLSPAIKIKRKKEKA